MSVNALLVVLSAGVRVYCCYSDAVCMTVGVWLVGQSAGQ